MTEKEIIQEIAGLNLRLVTIQHELAKKSRDGIQFGYKNTPELARNVSYLESVSTKINEIVFSKTQ